MIQIRTMISRKITPLWILIASLYRIGPVQAVDLQQKPSFLSANLGEAVTIYCTFDASTSNERMVWYKQKVGQTLQHVGIILSNVDPLLSDEFKQSGIQLDVNKSSISLTIPHTTKDDEGTYFCGLSHATVIKFSTGTFLSVTGPTELNVSLLQTPVRGSVSPGESVTLQCTVLSDIRAAELRVLWFRAAAGQSFPEIIYTHQNSSSRHCEISSSTSCSVYNFSKNILDHNHTGTYYCAVAACGKIIFGNGTTVELRRSLDSIVFYLGAALGVCVVVISAQAILIHKRKSEHSSVRLQHGSVVENPTSQDSAAVELIYAAKSLRMKSGRSKHSVYSEVRYFSVTDHH
ncbi:uncharacterized protein LOC118806972 isoform X2 [Colossoma macropomum]|uniref:uncharacterized protein LOC118806972 isoform X2 n=1 Tax=Colossoma macropomum TaxID=42526 RepID=UPI0018652A9B|nr:uncharacterized protein LOC118806972 isoform X2 [Colossoma macropomum]